MAKRNAGNTANVSKGVIGPDGKQGMKDRELIAQLKAVETEKDGKTTTSYYMNAQLAQYNGSPNAKGHATSSPYLSPSHSYGDDKSSHDLRITKAQYEDLIAKCGDKVCDGPDGSKICGFKSNLMVTSKEVKDKDGNKTKVSTGLMPSCNSEGFTSITPTTSKKFGPDAWKTQKAVTNKAYQKKQSLSKSVEAQAEAQAAAAVEAEVEAPEMP